MPTHTGLPGLIKAFDSLRENQSEFVLATVTETAGSTYRKAGARMLITADGGFYGLLSGGCFEADLYEHARKVFTSKADHTVFYDMRSGDDLIWGLGLGCNGAVQIRLEYLGADNDFAPLSLIRRALEGGMPAVVMTVTASEHSQFRNGSHYLYTGDDRAGANILPPELLAGAAAVLSSGKSRSMVLTVGGQTVKVFFGMVRPARRLLIIGAGPDAVPVTEAAALLGWETTVADYREASARADRFPAAARVIHVTPEALPESVDPAAMDAAVLMTHNLDYDQRYLAQLAERPPAYIGLLGPAARKRQLLDGLEGRAGAIENNVYGPVGLDIGGELPEEIALSLVAEIQAVLHERTGRRLSAPAETAPPAASRDALHGLVLAAGGSRRFGALKQLLEFNGRSLLRQAAEKAAELLGDRVVVVHGPKATKCRRELAELDVRHVDNEEWDSGMGSSLRAGIRALPEDCRGVLILLCDQPMIEAGHLETLIAAWCEQPERIIAAQYGDGLGVPAIFPAAYFDALRRLTGDSGAKPLLTANADEVVQVPLQEAALDIDTQADYENLLTRKLSSG